MSLFPNGYKFHRLTVLGPSPQNCAPYFETFYLVQCECGNVRKVRGNSLKRGKSKSCGCLQREIASKNRSRKALATREWLYERYIVEKMPIKRIATLLGMKHASTVKGWIEREGIPLRSREERRSLINYVHDESHPNFIDGRSSLSQNRSYRSVYIPAQDRHLHRCTKNGSCPQHVFVFEQFIGRRLNDGEIVHHVNYDRLDNRLENLILLPSHKAHVDLHFYIEKLGAFFAGITDKMPAFEFPVGTIVPPGAKLPPCCTFADEESALQFCTACSTNSRFDGLSV